MTPAAEHRLYLDDRAAWARYVAPRWAKMLKSSDEAERRRMWSIASPELRQAVKALATRDAYRRTDPDTSRQAAERVTAIGSRADHVTVIVRAVHQHPGRTSAELAHLTGLERHEAARRTSDAEHQGLIRKGLPRPCTVSGKSAVTWFPPLTASQQACLSGEAA